MPMGVRAMDGCLPDPTLTLPLSRREGFKTFGGRGPRRLRRDTLVIFLLPQEKVPEGRMRVRFYNGVDK
jgi:hypothetical protein